MEDKRLRQLWVMTNEYHPNIIGGLGIVATQLAGTLARSGMKVTVICTSRHNRYTSTFSGTGMHIIRLPQSPRYFRKTKGMYRANAVIEAARVARASLPDLIHVHSTEFAEAAVEAGKRYRVPLVYTCHSLSSTGIHSREGKRQGLIIRNARHVTVPSRWQSTEIKKWYPKARRKVVVIPNGVKRITHRVHGPLNKLLYVGRIIPSKGIEELIRAVGRLSRRSKTVRLTVIGDGPTPYTRRMRALVRRLGIAGRVRWVRHQAHGALLRKYATYGAVVVPSRKESFCMVALEAMARSVPLVSTTSGGLKEFVHARNAQLIRDVDDAQIARAISRMWKQPAKTDGKVAKARMTASRYLWPAIARRYRTLFERST